MPMKRFRIEMSSGLDYVLHRMLKSWSKLCKSLFGQILLRGKGTLRDVEVACTAIRGALKSTTRVYIQDTLGAGSLRIDFVHTLLPRLIDVRR